jgi:hypothetical protein
MVTLLAVAGLVLVTCAIARLLARERALAAVVDGLAERVRELAARVDGTEADVGLAVTKAEIAESVLLDKGVADEEDLEAARRRFDGEGPEPEYVRGRDGEIH